MSISQMSLDTKVVKMTERGRATQGRTRTGTVTCTKQMKQCDEESTRGEERREEAEAKKDEREMGGGVGQSSPAGSTWRRCWPAGLRLIGRVVRQRAC